MKYLVTKKILNKNSVQTQSQIDRLNVFNAKKVKSKIITRDYDINLFDRLKKLAIDSSLILNMYDYFQGVTNLQGKILTVQELNNVDYQRYQLNYDNVNEPKLMDFDRVIARFKIDEKNLGVKQVEYLNRFNNKILTEYYDRRGFLSMEEMYHLDGSIANQIYYNLDYQPVLEVNYFNDENETKNYRLINYQGYDYTFDFENQLFLFFLDEINKGEPGEFIAEDIDIAFSVAAISNAKSKTAIFYENHVDSDDNLKEEYKQIINPVYGRFDNLIVADAKQADSLKRFTNISISVRPYFTLEFNEVKFEQRKNALMFVGHTTVENNLEDVYKTMAIVHKQIPEMELLLTTSGNDIEYRMKLNRLAAKYELADVVHNYIYTEFRKIEYNALMFITTSKANRFDFEAIKAMSHAIPVASYNNYEHEFVVDQFNGIVATNNTPLELANKIIKVCKNPKELKKLSKNAVQSVEKYTVNNFLNSEWFVDVKKNDEVELSFIVPIYNVENYLEQLLESIVNQKTFYNYEVIMVDDGSTDKSLEIEEAYLNRYDNFKLIKQKNLGPGVARNNGLKMVSGEVVSFIDSDDILEVNYVNTVMSNFIKKDIDVLKYGAVKINDDGSSTFGNNIFITEDANYQTGKEMFNYQINNKYYFVAVWTYAVRVKFLKEQKIVFPNLMLAEDDYFTFLVYQLSKNVVSISNIIYNYRIRNNSLIDTFSNKNKKKHKKIIYIEAFEEILKQIVSRNILINQEIRFYLVNQFLKIIFTRQEVISTSKNYVNIFNLIENYLGKDESKKLNTMIKQIF